MINGIHKLICGKLQLSLSLGGGKIGTGIMYNDPKLVYQMLIEEKHA
jgi:hypothetical protein